MSGRIVLMGSGELTATMVEVHKAMLAALGPSPSAVFLDTPAGFQLNADQISQRAVAYFDAHVRHPLHIVSFKSASTISAHEAEQAFSELRRARYVLIGPGSPTYAVRQWRQTPIPDIMARIIATGGCLVAASAAALTVGTYTLPVYEIYKVGEDLHWVEGIDILGQFGIRCAVIPHWNNAEGGTHDTRFCFMGEPRLRVLESLLPEQTPIIGIDEHTACIIDLSSRTVQIQGIGSVTMRHHGSERVFGHGTCVTLDQFCHTPAAAAITAAPPDQYDHIFQTTNEPGFWELVHRCEQRFTESLEAHQTADAVSALLELDRIIWQAYEQREDPERIAQAREIFREMIMVTGSRMESLPRSREACLAPLVEALLALRNRYREAHQWAVADALRACLEQAGITVDDIPQGWQWRLVK
ncbi:MAG: hypothetical protein N3B18_02705 [Desulfobacterota bacterium]|nr:hypothetical protein [Thermodesulfobacteriota bacterium]